MPKPSSNPDKAVSGGGGSRVEAGTFEITGACYRNVKSDFKDHVVVSLVLTGAVCDKDGDRVKDADPAEIILTLGDKSVKYFRPGQAKDGNDADPKNLGANADVEGNSVYVLTDSEQERENPGEPAVADFHKSCGYVVFNESLVRHGYPKDVLDQTYAPNYIGMKFALTSPLAQEINTRFGLRLNTKPFTRKDGTSQPVTYKIVDKWLNPAYVKNLGKAGSNGSSSGASAAAAAAPATEEKENWDGKSDEDLAVICLTKVSETRSGEKNLVKTIAQLKGLVTNQYTAKSKMPPARLKAVQDLITNATWSQEQVEMLGGTWGAEPALVVFP